MRPYIHKVQYYETDKMGITHHSNYIRWMEEARVDFLAQIGWNLETLEAMGMVSPVTGLECRYRESTYFPEPIAITVAVKEFRGVRLRLGYTMCREDGTLVFEGTSEHCFLDEKGSIVRLKKASPEFAALLSQLASGEE